jgi:hypothetical protein
MVALVRSPLLIVKNGGIDEIRSRHAWHNILIAILQNFGKRNDEE